MKSKDGFVQAYNGQIAVDSHAQVIVAQRVTQSAADAGELVPLVVEPDLRIRTDGNRVPAYFARTPARAAACAADKAFVTTGFDLCMHRLDPRRGGC